MLTVQQTLKWIELFNEKVQEEKDYLTKLDRAIGDGDHGINMARGFQEVANQLKEASFDDVASVLKKVATTVVAKVGGASGPLYGTAFLKMAMAGTGKDVDEAVFSEMVEAALEGIKQRGKSSVGEKTMVDVWTPVLQVLKEQGFAADAIRETAEAAMKETEGLVATKGRAAYLKERSKGHIDPGSASSYYLFAALADALEGSE